MTDNTELDKDTQKNDDAWNIKDFTILGIIFVLFAAGIYVALHMDLITMEIKDRKAYQKQEKQVKEEQQESEKQIDVTAYMKDLEKKVRKNWKVPDKKPEKPTVVEFALRKDGKVTATAIAESCGDPELDKKAIEAIEKSSPFKKLPKEFKGEGVMINFKFDFKE